MNNQNNSNQPPKPGPESDWAEFIEQQGQSLTPGSQPQLPLPLDDLDSQQLADLQLDGQLRMLRHLSDPGDSFVDDVLAQTQVDSTADTNSKSRLPVIAPVFEHQTPTPEANSDLATQDDQLNEQKLSPAARENLLPHKTIATLVSVATAIAVGLLIWGMGGDHSNSPISSQQAGQNLANSSSTQSSDGLVDPSNKSIASTPTVNEAIVVHSIPDLKSGPNDGHHPDQPNLIADNPQPLIPLDNKNRPQLDQPPRGSVEIVDADPAPRFQWHLAIDFQKNGLGSITLNDEPISGSLLVDNADFVLRQLGDELTRRVQFLETRLGSEISASINIDKTEFPFKRISELEPTMERTCKHFATLESSNLSISEFAELRESNRQMVYQNPTATTSIDLQNRQIAFSTEDEVFTICSVLGASESALRKTAKQRLAWEKRQNYQVPDNFPATSITPKAFIDFATNGELVLSTPKTQNAEFSRIQNLDEKQLKKILYSKVGSFDLFSNTRDFRRAEQAIATSAQRFEERVTKQVETIAQALAVEPVDKARLTELLLAQEKRTDLESKKYFVDNDIYAQGLPLVMEDKCRSSRDDAVAIDLVSSTLGSAVNQFDPSLGSRDPSKNDAFRIRELKKQLKIVTDASMSPQHLKTSDQILQIDHPRMRLELIEALERSKTDTALKLLAKRAKFDFVPEVRLAATTALAGFSRDQYREELLAGLKYPWHVIAQHSAEALVRLNDQEAIPELIAMLDLPHPNAPVQVDKNKFVQPELVAINHMRNCLLCHAPAGSSHDIATGVIPSWDKPLPKQYYKSENPHSPSVRADVTYLEQDFSVVQPVKRRGKWPRDQRFDYVVQQKPIKRTKANQVSKKLAKAPNLNREAIVFALQKLTNETPADNSSKSWKAILQRREAKLP